MKRAGRDRFMPRIRVKGVILAMVAAVFAMQGNASADVPGAAYPAEGTVITNVKSYGEDDAAAFFADLEKDGDLKLTLTDDIYDRIGTAGTFDYDNFVKYRCTLGSGIKVIDLNGHDINVSYDARASYGESTIFRVDENATLVINDSDGDGVINYNGSLSNSCSPFIVVRNIIEVDGGELRVNGGNISAGRSSKFYDAGKARSFYKQINGVGILARSGKVVINGGKISGRGFTIHEKAGGNVNWRASALEKFKDCEVHINDGELIGEGCANSVYDWDSNYTSDISIKGGIFNVYKQDCDIVLTKSVSSACGTSYGRIGFNYLQTNLSGLREYKRGRLDRSKLDETEDFVKTNSKLTVTADPEVDMKVTATGGSNKISWDKVGDATFNAGLHFNYTLDGAGFDDDWYLHDDRKIDGIKEHYRTFVFNIKDVSGNIIVSKESPIAAFNLANLTEEERAKLLTDKRYYLSAEGYEYWDNYSKYKLKYKSSNEIKIDIIDPYDLNGGGLSAKNEGSCVFVKPAGTFKMSYLDGLVSKGTVDSYDITVSYKDKNGNTRNIDPVRRGLFNSGGWIELGNNVTPGYSTVTYSVSFKKNDKSIVPANNTKDVDICSMPDIRVYDSEDNELIPVNGQIFVNSAQTLKLRIPDGIWPDNYLRWGRIDTQKNKFEYPAVAPSQSKEPSEENATLFTVNITEDHKNDGFYCVAVNGFYPSFSQLPRQGAYADMIYIAYKEPVEAEIKAEIKTNLDTADPAVFVVNETNHLVKNSTATPKIQTDCSGPEGYSFRNPKVYYVLSSYPSQIEDSQLPENHTYSSNNTYSKNFSNMFVLDDFKTGDYFDYYKLPAGDYVVSGYMTYNENASDGPERRIDMQPVTIRVMHTAAGIAMYSGEEDVSEMYVTNGIVGSSKFFNVRSVPEAATVAGSPAWTSSDSQVASVDNEGVVTFKKPGTAVITCTKGGFSTSATVTVPGISIEGLETEEPVFGGQIPVGQRLSVPNGAGYQAYLSYFGDYEQGDTFKDGISYVPVIRIYPDDGMPFPAVYDAALAEEGYDPFVPVDNTMSVTVNGKDYYGCGSWCSDMNRLHAYDSPVCDGYSGIKKINYMILLQGYPALKDTKNDYVDTAGLSLVLPQAQDAAPADIETADQVFRPEAFAAGEEGIRATVFSLPKLVTGLYQDDDPQNDVCEDSPVQKYLGGKTYRLEVSLQDGFNRDDCVNDRGGTIYFDKALTVDCETARAVLVPIDGSNLGHYRTAVIYFTVADEASLDGEGEIISSHIGLEKVEAKAPDCTTDGNTEYYICRDEGCGIWFEDAGATKEIADHEKVIIHKTGHDYGTDDDWVIVTQPQEGKSGLKKRVCKNGCGTDETQVIPAIEHVHGAVLSEKIAAKTATCTEDGNKEYYKCSCGKWFEDEACTVQIIDASSVVIKAAGHDFGVWTKSKEATATEQGEETRTCKNCGLKDTRKTGLAGHVHDAELTEVEGRAPTCSENGIGGYYKCSGCDVIFKSDTASAENETTMDQLLIPALGHDIEAVAETAPKCETPGKKAHFRCKREGCGMLFFDEAGLMSVENDAALEIPEPGHDWGTWEVTTQASVSQNGVETRICKNDPSHKETRQIPRTGVYNVGQTAVEGGIKYEVTSIGSDTEMPTVRVTGLTDEAKATTENLVIKETVIIHDHEYKITEIADDAFKDDTTLCTVDIGADAAIGDGAFEGCKGLTDVSVTGAASIGENAFKGCINLEIVVLSDKVLSIGDSAFEKSDKLNITAPEGSKGAEYAQNNGIKYHSDLQNEYVTVDYTIEPEEGGTVYLMDEMLNDLDKSKPLLKNTGIVVSCIGAEGYIFKGIYESGSLVSDKSFYPTTVDTAHKYVVKFEKITSPDTGNDSPGDDSSGDDVSKDQKGVGQPDSQPVIEDNPPVADESVMPSTVTYKAGDQFIWGKARYKILSAQNEKLTVVYLENTDKKAKKASIPDSVKYEGQTFRVTEIAAKSFAKNVKLKSVTIGKNVEKIGEQAFSGCKALKKITIKTSGLKSIGARALKGVHKKCVIKVPKSVKKVYIKLFKKKGQAKTVKIR